MKTSDAFERYDSNLNLDPDERLRAEAFHTKLSLGLNAEGLISGSFLQGSFARKTMLKPLRDIDKVLILHEDLQDLKSQEQGAQDAAAMVEQALQRMYPNARVERSRHAIKLDLGENTFSFDVVPAFELDDDSGDVLITDLGQDGFDSAWKRSNTRRLIDVVRSRNKDCGGRFVHQVRFVKHWARQHLEDVLPGLHVESIAFACVDEQLRDDEAVERIFVCGARLLGPLQEYTDPTGVDRISRKLGEKERELAFNAFVEASEIANAAMERGRQGDSDGANSLWYSIFGDPFPEPGKYVSDYLRSLALGGSVAASGATAGVARATRAWRPDR